MNSRIRKSFLLGLSVAAIVCAADNPFAGTWKLNPEKSKFTGDTMTYSRASGGGYKYSGGGLSYTFKPDGQERAGLMGEMVTWKQIDDHTWEVTHKTKGNITSTETMKLSEDGKTLDITIDGKRANGETYQDKAVYERTAGDNGIVGSWKSTKVQISSPETVEIKDYEDNGITFSEPAQNFTFSGKFDGKAYPATGPTVPEGAMGKLRRLGPNSFELVEIYKGKPIWKGTYTLSDDKRTLTVVGSMVGVNEPETAVYERQ